MPAVVNEYVSRGKLVLVPNMQHEILGNYVADMAKYASAETLQNPAGAGTGSSLSPPEKNTAAC